MTRPKYEYISQKKAHSPNPPATPTLHQAMATSPPGGRCAAVPRACSDVMDDISRSGSPVSAVRGGVFGDGGSARRGGRATTGRGDAEPEEAEHCLLLFLVVMVL